MNRHVNSIAGRLSLRPPQRQSLEILDRILEITPVKHGADVAAALETIKSEFATVSDFEREFPSLCFALATGVGKTRLMGAFISYLHLAHGLNHFFVLAPNLTIYNKLIADFSPNTPKYVFKGIAEFAINAPVIITGDNYAERDPRKYALFNEVQINIFNISKINSEVRGGKLPRIKRLSEYIGESYFDYLAGLDDLVLLMDESHRYRAEAGMRAINELKPILGLELTATPFVEVKGGNKKPAPFKNIIFHYPLSKAMEDGFVKEPAVVTRKDFNPTGMTTEEIERLKLEDGIRLHEQIKVELETYARQTENKIVKPFVLVIARDTTHAGQLLQLIQSDQFFNGNYKEKVIQVDSSKTGKEEDEMVERLLKVEHTEEPTEIVIHVNMLKEGWDVTNLYTIVPLRAANARTLIEQSIGRGLRLPYGKRTGVMAIDRLNIVAHDKFQEIVEEAGKPDSTIRLQTLVLSGDELQEKMVTVVSAPRLDVMLGRAEPVSSVGGDVAKRSTEQAYASVRGKTIALAVQDCVKRLENYPDKLQCISHIEKPEIQAQIIREVLQKCGPEKLGLGDMRDEQPVDEIVANVSKLIVKQTIDIPRIHVAPKGAVKATFKRFNLDLSSMRYQAPSNELWIQHLRTNEREVLGLGEGGIEEARLEDYVVSSLVDYDDVAYDQHADLLYDLAAQVVKHLLNYLSEDEARRVLRVHQKDIARFVHAQMQGNFVEEATEYEVKVSKGFTSLVDRAFTAKSGEDAVDFRTSPPDKSRIARYIFTGFERCLYDTEKFQADGERKLAVILDREALKWFKPARGQFRIYYQYGGEHPEYQPDFVAELEDCIVMLEPKASNELDSTDVVAKKEAAVKWCQLASDYAETYGGKPWHYVLIPHNEIAENMTVKGLVERFGGS